MSAAVPMGEPDIPRNVAAEDALHLVRKVQAPIGRYLVLRKLKAEHPRTFYSLLIHNVHEILPFVYTPTVGEACQRYHKLPIQPWGLYITWHDRGNILQKLQKWQLPNVRIAVATDGERILGLGDLGAGGMGISEGKIMLYTVAAGVNPDMCLPICLDVGTNNQQLLDDPLYKGVRQRRPPYREYIAFMAEFMQALRDWQPYMVLQFEDFHNTNAFRLLLRYQPKFPCFNDDIQVLSAIRATSKALSEHTFLFLGAGEAGVGIGELIAKAIAVEAGCTMQQARRRCCFVDSKGLVVQSRDGLQEHKKAFAHAMPPRPNLMAAVHALQPSVLIGVSTAAGAFTKDVLQAMAAHNDRPIVFPLSNPTQLSECTFADALKWTDGRVLFASGSPFKPETDANGITVHPAQANNAYVFPAIGHAAVLSHAQSIPDEVFLIAAQVLARATSRNALDRGWIFPSFDDILTTSRTVMMACCEHFESCGLGCRPGTSWQQVIDQALWVPTAPSKL